MPRTLRSRVLRWWRRAPWATLGGLIVLLYLIGFAVIAVSEPVSNPLRGIGTYSYFFVMTITTVGYGDVVPITAAGRFAASMIAIGGIGAAAVALGQLFNLMGEWARRRERGLLSFDMKGHIVIFGNRGAETAALIRTLIADPQSSGMRVVLCSYKTERNPFPDFIDFVHGELTSADVMTRACASEASRVIIHAGTDYESITIALAVKEVNSEAMIVVRANDPGREVDIERVDRRRVVCIKSMDVPLIVREIHNPGITQVLEKLMASDNQDLRSLRTPDGVTPLRFGPLAHYFRQEHGAILIGMRPPAGSGGEAMLNPAYNALVEGGMFLDYISRNPVALDWTAAAPATAESAVS